ncbi:MAG: hypothetical protein ACM3NQ_19685 [Bacteroidales bacterium]
MTYNFDVDRWYERQRHLLDARRAGGEIADDEYERELEALEQRYEEMGERLDGSFQLPDKGLL